MGIHDYKTPDSKPESREDMIAYLRDHPRYYTMNGNNLSTSYARGIKVHYVVPHELVDRAFELLGTEAANDFLHDQLSDFNQRNGDRWQLGTNGRSGGYVVLYQSRIEGTGYKSRCRNCRQETYKTVEETGGARCGRCGKDARVNYPGGERREARTSGRGTDEPGEVDFDDWDDYSLGERVAAVYDMDQTVDTMIEDFIAMCRTAETVVCQKITWQEFSVACEGGPGEYRVDLALVDGETGGVEAAVFEEKATGPRAAVKAAVKWMTEQMDDRDDRRVVVTGVEKFEWDDEEEEPDGEDVHEPEHHPDDARVGDAQEHEPGPQGPLPGD